MIQIDHGIPIPPPRKVGRPKGVAGRTRYPWRSMEVGDSFVFSGDLPAAYRAFQGRRLFDRNSYTARLVDGIVRIWRTA